MSHARLAWLVLACGCDLYFSHDHVTPAVTPDALSPDAGCYGDVFTDAGTCRVTELPLPDVAASTGDTLFAVVDARADHWFVPSLWWWPRATGVRSQPITGDKIIFDGAIAVARTYEHGIGFPDTYPEVSTCLGGQCSVLYTDLAKVPWLLGAHAGQAYMLDVAGTDVLACSETSCTSPASIATGIATCGWSMYAYLNCSTDAAPGGGGSGGVLSAVDDAGLYVISAGQLYAIPYGQPATAIAMPGDTVRFFAVVSNTLYWATSAGDIFTCPTAATTCTPSLYASAPTGITGFHVDATSVYWLDTAGNIVSCPRTGCTSPSKLYACGAVTTTEEPTMTPWIPSEYRLTGDASYLYCVHPAPPPADGAWGAWDVLQIAKQP